MDFTPPNDPARFAQSIRDLAHDAHRVLDRPASPMALRRLSRRIDALARTLGDRRSSPVGAWLVNLGRQVRSTPARRPAPHSHACLGAR